MPLNKDRLLKIADAIEKESVAKFDMGDWLSPIGPRDRIDEPCGTAACVAGHACIISQMENGCSVRSLWDAYRGDKIDIDVEARKLLGLNSRQADELFCGGSVGLWKLTNSRQRAADCLRWMANNNTVSWHKAAKGIGWNY